MKEGFQEGFQLEPDGIIRRTLTLLVPTMALRAGAKEKRIARQTTRGLRETILLYNISISRSQLGQQTISTLSTFFQSSIDVEDFHLIDLHNPRGTQDLLHETIFYLLRPQICLSSPKQSGMSQNDKVLHAGW